jgi:mRNA interferase YafQ
MREIFQKNRFKADLKRIKRSGRHDVTELLLIVNDLANDVPLSEKYHDHALSGDWIDHRDCHIRSDWVLIYRLEPDQLILVRTGSHSELFD